MVFSTRLLQILALSATVTGRPLQRRGILPPNQIVGLGPAVPIDMTGALYQAYQPYLDVINGCVPFPAVDINGNTNAGLPTTGSQNSGCSSNLGQIYSRGTSSKGHYAIMYAWYMPKDSPSTGLGHRHEWEGVIIWLASMTSTSVSNILAVCPSAHGKWKCSRSFRRTGSGVWIAYFGFWPIDHSMWLGSKQGGQQPLIAWESLPSVARDALQITNFGSATVPFKDGTFARNIAAANF
ncbi:putative NPP1 domain protein [Stipitochalara longipes BDJ]|nr:putative NPP1 domain protein [Stipitochalara longipes BDJ]